MSESLIVEGVSKCYRPMKRGARREVWALKNVSFAVEQGTILGIVGPNGAGKTTLLKVLARITPPSEGRIIYDGADITGEPPHRLARRGIARTFQIVQPFASLTVRENIAVGSHLSRPARADALVSSLAYGEKRRLEIGLALANSPSLLLLDEPLAGMSPRERIETVKLLKSISQGRTMIIIDHDMDALFELAGRITVLQEGRVLVEGTPEEIKSNPKVQEAYLGGVLES